MRKAYANPYHPDVGRAVICWGVGFNRQGELAYIIGVDEAHEYPYSISKQRDGKYGIWCKRDEFRFYEDDSA